MKYADDYTVEQVFGLEESAKEVVKQYRALVDQKLSAVRTICEELWPWMTKDEWKRRGWCQKGQPPYRVPPVTFTRYLDKERDRVVFHIERVFEGSDRHGSPDLYFERDFSVPVQLLESGNMDNIRKYIIDATADQVGATYN